jgi:hypothetical protein
MLRQGRKDAQFWIETSRYRSRNETDRGAVIYTKISNPALCQRVTPDVWDGMIATPGDIQGLPEVAMTCFAFEPAIFQPCLPVSQIWVDGSSGLPASLPPCGGLQNRYRFIPMFMMTWSGRCVKIRDPNVFRLNAPS